ncbi:MAG: hypothetical protein ACM35G_03035 [Planctomycetaceae bacterium]
MFMVTQRADPAIHDAAVRMARRCRFLVQACLREDEWGEADREFYGVIREELENFVGAVGNRAAAAKGRPRL